MSWQGTPYMHNQQVKGRAVNCLRFACGVWDDLFGWHRELPNDLPGDTGFHNPKAAWLALRELLKVYPEHMVVRDRDVEPGDLVVVSTALAGPSHAYIVGFQPNTLWHAIKPAVCWTGIQLDFRTNRVRRIYRIRDRRAWL